MIIKSKTKHDIASSEITPEAAYLARREFLKEAGLIGVATASFFAGFPEGAQAQAGRKGQGQGQDLKAELTSYEDVTSYNNYYEFGTDKEDPKDNAKNFKTKPWSVKVDGLVNKPATYQLEDFVKPHTLEERIYRHRCVEAWSMVIPWLGFPMVDLIKRVEPMGSAKYIEFTTLLDPKQMPGQRLPILEWPYVEGLRLDEAMHPLTIFVVGLYGKTLPNQNGAPLRHVVPWKYGFKGCKSIVRMRFTDKEPRTAWNVAAPHEYGFYANVNPTVDHPRWSQARERVVGKIRRRETEMFNGYADQVQGLYAGMDLRKFY
ncbi:MAG: protein-methionine-sulfoxide reductase catalytic subunit MsrP [Gemmatimonadaceae bacterium]